MNIKTTIILWACTICCTACKTSKTIQTQDTNELSISAIEHTATIRNTDYDITDIIELMPIRNGEQDTTLPAWRVHRTTNATITTTTEDTTQSKSVVFGKHIGVSNTTPISQPSGARHNLYILGFLFCVCLLIANLSKR